MANPLLNWVNVLRMCPPESQLSPPNVAAHTSPVYVTCGRTRLFDGPAAEHMLSLVEGGMEYLQTLATVFDERSRRRMVKLFKEARRELKGRLTIEGGHPHPHPHPDGSTPYHRH